MKRSVVLQLEPVSSYMMQQDPNKALQAVARALAEAGHLREVHPVVVKRALQEVYDRAHERAAQNEDRVLSRLTSLWRAQPSPEQQYASELAAMLNCTFDEAQAHLHTLWDCQNAHNPVEAFQRHAITCAFGSNEETPNDFTLYWVSLRGVSRLDCRALLEDLMRLSGQLGCEPWEALAPNCAGAPPRWFTVFFHRLAAQAGYYFEMPPGDPLRSTGVYLENLTQEQAALLLNANARLDGEPLLDAERQALQRVLGRDADLEAYYDGMAPIDAWHELCAFIGWDNVYETVIENMLLISTMLYELGAVAQSEHIAGLCRAAHLAVYAPPTTGLAQRLGVGPTSSPREVADKLNRLTSFERHDLSRAMAPLTTSLEESLRLEGVRINPPGRTFVSAPSQAVRKLTEISAEAVGPVGSWQFLTNLCGLHHLAGTRTPAARNELAAALVTRHPDGMDPSIELLAYQARILPRVRAEYAARRQERASHEKRTLQHQL